MKKTKVLIVDDSAMMRKVLSVGLSEDPELEVLAAASGAEMAEHYISRNRPDVITLDLEMPHTDGLSFLRKYMATVPIPTVVISSYSQRGQKVTMDAFEAGAVDVIAKPSMGPNATFGSSMNDICRRVKAAARARVVAKKIRGAPPLYRKTLKSNGMAKNWLFAIGASTGGVQALAEVLPKLPPDCPPIVIVQHMPEGFTQSFANRLNSISKIFVSEAKSGDVLRTGHAFIAPGGDRHMVVRRSSGKLLLDLVPGEKVCFSRPSVDVLFDSVAKVAMGKVSAAILTGMGSDGANGMLKIRKTGGATFAQDEASCVVFGMPHAAQKNGATSQIIALSDVAEYLMGSIGAVAGAHGVNFANKGFASFQ